MKSVLFSVSLLLLTAYTANPASCMTTTGPPLIAPAPSPPSSPPTCQAPMAMNMQKMKCMNCPRPSKFLTSLNRCSCPKGQGWDMAEFKCIRCPKQVSYSHVGLCVCLDTKNHYFNTFHKTCLECPGTMQPSGNLGLGCKCPNHSYFNMKTQACVCAYGMTMNSAKTMCMMN